jgi:hypothetical protein
VWFYSNAITYLLKLYYINYSIINILLILFYE